MKKKLLILFFSCLIFALPGQAQFGSIVKKANNTLGVKSFKFDSVPTTVAGFKAMRDEIATTPMGGAAVFLLALKVYVDNPDLGNKFLVLSTDKSLLAAGDVYKGYDIVHAEKVTLDEQLKKYPYVVNSYIKGATPKNSYKAKLPYIFQFTLDPNMPKPENGRLRLYVKCSGADSNRPMWVKKNSKGIWKMDDWGSIIVGVRPPANMKDDDDL